MIVKKACFDAIKWKWKLAVTRNWTHDSWFELPMLLHYATSIGQPPALNMQGLLHECFSHTPGSHQVKNPYWVVTPIPNTLEIKTEENCSTYRELWEIVVVQVVVVEPWLPKQSPGFDSRQLLDVQFALFKMSETHIAWLMEKHSSWPQTICVSDGTYWVVSYSVYDWSIQYDLCSMCTLI